MIRTSPEFDVVRALAEKAKMPLKEAFVKIQEVVS